MGTKKRCIFEFDQSDWLWTVDWKQLEGGKGAISVYAIYGLTNVFKMSALNASAFVTASVDITKSEQMRH